MHKWCCSTACGLWQSLFPLPPQSRSVNGTTLNKTWTLTFNVLPACSLEKLIPYWLLLYYYWLYWMLVLFALHILPCMQCGHDTPAEYCSQSHLPSHIYVQCAHKQQLYFPILPLKNPWKSLMKPEKRNPTQHVVSVQASVQTVWSHDDKNCENI